MQRDRSAFDAAPRTEISADVKQNFVGLHVVVHPRDLDRFRMRIEQARRERADDVTAHFKGLMNRRRLMHGAGDRFEVGGVEGKRIEIPVPAERIERMMRVHHPGQARAILHQHVHIFFAIDR